MITIFWRQYIEAGSDDDVSVSASQLLQLLYLVPAYWPQLALSLILYYLLANRYHRGLHKIPGPWPSSLSPFRRIWSVYKGASHEDEIALHKKYGPLVRVAPNLVSVSSPAEINTIYGTSSGFLKGSFYSVVEAYDEEGLIPDPFVLNDKQLHARVRRGAANAYSLNSLVRLEPCLDAVTERLVNKLTSEHVSTNKVVAMAPLLQEYAMDAIFALTFGKDLNHMDRGDHLRFFKTSKVITAYMAIIGQIPWMHKFLMGNSLIASFFDCTEGNEEIIKLVQGEIEADRNSGPTTRQSNNGPVTFLQRLLRSQKTDPTSISDREIIVHCFNNITAGSDTTAIALRSILFYTLSTPMAYTKLAKEVRDAFPNEREVRSVTFSATSKLAYLGAVIKEAIRIHPSAGMMLPRIVPKTGATVCGRYLQPGVEVGINPWVLHHDPNVFDDPDVFRPERWLPENTSADQLREMNRSWIPFGHGSHTCSGRWISWMEIHKAVATLVLLFDMELSSQGDRYSFHNLWLVPQTGLNISFQLRR